MSLEEIYSLLPNTSTIVILIIVLVIILGKLIKITPLQINIWEWLARKLGNSLNYNTMEQIKQIEERQKDIEQKLDTHIKENERDQILRARKSILVFAREVVNGTSHTREEFQECLSYIDSYESYCKEHPDFPNNRAVLAIEMIKDNYSERLEKADFLAEGYKNSKRDKK